MANSAEPSSSLGFTSSHLSNGFSSNNTCASMVSEPGTEPCLEIVSLRKLSSNLEQLLVDSGFNHSDAEIIVEGIPVGVHRCILAARSRFFHELFMQEEGSSGKEAKRKHCMSDLVPHGKVGYEAFVIFLSYIYTGKLKPSPREVAICVDAGCAHDACQPAIKFSSELMYVSAIFQIPELVSLFQRRLHNFVDKAFAEDVIPILLVSFHCQLSQLLSHCVQRVARSELDRVFLEKELPHEVVDNIKSLRLKSQPDEESNVSSVDPLREKSIGKIHRALDSDDVELVKLLLTESNITLDDAYALHYASAYCDPKVVNEVLGLGLADVNLRNSQGYTVLHVAAMRKEPSVIISLLTKGANASELTLDGQTAVSICRRLTRPKDYDSKTMQGQESNKDRICIDILEREMRRKIPMAGDASTSSPMIAENLHMKLLYLENRVAFAHMFFPTEARLAMDIAHAETTSELSDRSSSKNLCGNLRELDLNETPTMQRKRLCLRMETLRKTVEMGRRYFPHCSQVLDKFLEDDLPDLCYLEKGTPDEQRIKRKRYVELKDDVQEAFNKDKAEFNHSGLSSSSSSSSLKDLVTSLNHKELKF